MDALPLHVCPGTFRPGVPTPEPPIRRWIVPARPAMHVAAASPRMRKRCPHPQRADEPPLLPAPSQRPRGSLQSDGHDSDNQDSDSVAPHHAAAAASDLEQRRRRFEADARSRPLVPCGDDIDTAFAADASRGQARFASAAHRRLLPPAVEDPAPPYAYRTARLPAPPPSISSSSPPPPPPLRHPRSPRARYAPATARNAPCRRISRAEIEPAPELVAAVAQRRRDALARLPASAPGRARGFQRQGLRGIGDVPCERQAELDEAVRRDDRFAALKRLLEERLARRATVAHQRAARDGALRQRRSSVLLRQPGALAARPPAVPLAPPFTLRRSADIVERSSHGRGRAVPGQQGGGAPPLLLAYAADAGLEQREFLAAQLRAVEAKTS